MVTAKDIEADRLIPALAEVLRRIPELKQPEWAMFVKTGPHKQRPPIQTDWWYIRASSILRRIYLDGPVGVERLRTYYGGRKRRGVKPEHTVKASGKVIRAILQQLEKAGLVAKQPGRGRVITPRGQALLDKLAAKICSSGG
uniref:Small ribosomal subunit protein eS19 n=1 Tax=uncultured korarchaeote TaxID=161241 RepID=A0A1L2JJV0_9CREN|nr:ribosomal protein S19E (S16A) [uncultured korarchaeote]